MGTTDADRITTNALLGKLERRGLGVTRNMLGQDVKARYLPLLTPDPRGDSAGIGRFWEPWTVERAIYLYRLRRLGAKGPVLRLLLYFRDGWGWETVQPICVEGLAKLITVERTPVNRTTRTISPRALDSIAQDAARGSFQNETTVRFTWGMGFFGAPLAGGSLLPLIQGFDTVYGKQTDPALVSIAEGQMAKAGLSWELMQAEVMAADAERAEAARLQFRAAVRWWQSIQRDFLQAHGHRDQSANPLTFFGVPPTLLRETFRTLPGRVTPAQVLGGWFCVFLAAEPTLRDLARRDQMEQEEAQ